MAVDEWIAVIDAHNLLLQQSQETAAEAERKREEATSLGQKRKRTQDNDVSDSDEEGEISDDETTALPRPSADLISSVTTSTRSPSATAVT